MSAIVTRSNETAYSNADYNRDFSFLYDKDARVSDYVVDGVEPTMPIGGGHYYNVTPGSAPPSNINFGSAQSSTHRSHNLVSAVSPGARVVLLFSYGNSRRTYYRSIFYVRLGGVNPSLIVSTPLETQHTSLKRKKDPLQQTPALYSPILERSEVSRPLNSRKL